MTGLEMGLAVALLVVSFALFVEARGHDGTQREWRLSRAQAKDLKRQLHDTEDRLAVAQAKLRGCGVGN